MDGYVLICSALIAVFCLPSSEGTAFHIHIEEKADVNGDCVKYFTVEGDGINDIFSTSCHAEVDRVSIMNGILVIGDYTKHRVSVYSNKPSSMVVIHGEGDKQCEERTYTPGHKNTRELPEAECKQFKDLMTAKWKGSKSKRTHHNHGKSHFFKWFKTQESSGTVNEDMYVITSFVKDKENGKCDGTMVLGRSKLTYEENYDECRLRRISFIPEGVIIGDYRTKDGVTRISDSVDSVVSIYPDSVCDKMLFVENGGSWALGSQPTLDENDCNSYKKKITDWLDSLKDIFEDDSDVGGEVANEGSDKGEQKGQDSVESSGGETTTRKDAATSTEDENKIME